MKKIKIALGDLRHKTVGRHSVFMPVGIGYIASYALSQVGNENIEIRLYDDAKKLLTDINQWRPEVVGLSNYCWNTELSSLVFKYAKKKNPLTICVSGGPNFPKEKKMCQDYLREKPEIDFYVYFDGELAFTKLLKKIVRGESINLLKSQVQAGIMSIHPRTKKLVEGQIIPRPINLDIIPSPYLNGLMDQWFNGYFAPSIETCRGCPFTCAYCHVGNDQKCIAAFSVQRIKNELTYIAKKMQKYPNILLSICDSNFGMYPRDEVIAKHCRALQNKYGWPNVFNVTTGKANHDRILKIVSILNKKMTVSCSVQSLNPKTLKIIGRKNIPMDEYRRLQARIKQRGMSSAVEFIVPMPEETKKSFFNGIRKVIETGVEIIIPYTTMLLPGTFLAAEYCRQKYHFKSKFRLIPRQFGNYNKKKCFEIEEVCVATNTLSFKDYLEVRGFSLILSFFADEQFDIIRRHIKEMALNYYDFVFNLWKLIKSGRTALSTTYNEYLKETKKELMDSRKAIYNYFAKSKNYAKLLRGELGDNLIRKYNLKLLVKCCKAALELAYDSILKVKTTKNKIIINSLNEARAWVLATRDLSVFKNNRYKNIDRNYTGKFDVESWYKDNNKQLTNYEKRNIYRIYYDAEKLNKVFKQAAKLYGKDFDYQFSKLLIYYGPKYFWCKVNKID